MKVKHVTVAIDLMGGDNAPFGIIDGISIAARRHEDVSFLLCGNQDIVRQFIPDFDSMGHQMIHVSDVVKADDKPSNILRNALSTSMGMAVDMVKHGKADVIVSSGNTGALMAISKYSLRTIGSIKRPAICTIIPAKKPVVLLDLGANIQCDEKNYLDFAAMGHAFAYAIMNKNNGTIGILNIGHEKNKGGDILNAAYDLISKSSLSSQFIGYVEPSDIANGLVDIVVTDGFSGNIFLKTAESVLSLMKFKISQSFNDSLLAKIGYMFASGSLKKLHEIDPNRYNGAMLVGLNGIVVKSHGSATGESFANAIDRSIVLARHNVNDIIAACLDLNMNINPLDSSTINENSDALD